ncbi:hypothetical protein F383_19845 [Gossypium arboreum]|uniref:Uncharacterized protein n=1 Tax=Gossypium arboreum TaxID=29729 RepID=A0A0B0NI89_GOSAR|nr:hypothetical protein F383_19845 [Gossypium arboreum]
MLHTVSHMDMSQAMWYKLVYPLKGIDLAHWRVVGRVT